MTMAAIDWQTVLQGQPNDEPGLACISAIISCIYAKEHYDFFKYHDAEKMSRDADMSSEIRSVASSILRLQRFDDAAIALKQRILGATSDHGGRHIIDDSTSMTLMVPIIDATFLRIAQNK